MSDVTASLKPRKQPVQSRSSATIQTLHAAAIQVLSRDGISRCTTTRIAERAGISVGSIYQYYPNRNSLLAAVLIEHVESVCLAMEKACAQHHGKSLTLIASAIVETFLSAKLRNPTESKALFAVASELGGPAAVAKTRDRIVAAVSELLASAGDGCFINPTVTATIALGALVGPVQALLEGDATDSLQKSLRHELTILLNGYLHTCRDAGP